MTPVDTLWVRHGESVWNRAGLMQGRVSWPYLTYRGRRQAFTAAEELRSFGPRRVVSSDLWRAAETAGIIAGRLALPADHSVLLRERSWGIFEGRPAAEGNCAESRLAPDQAVPQGESRVDVSHRLCRFVSELAPTGGPIVVVTHGDVIREAVEMWSDDSPSATAANGCVVRLSVRQT